MAIIRTVTTKDAHRIAPICLKLFAPLGFLLGVSHSTTHQTPRPLKCSTVASFFLVVVPLFFSLFNKPSFKRLIFFNLSVGSLLQIIHTSISSFRAIQKLLLRCLVLPLKAANYKILNNGFVSILAKRRISPGR